MNASFNYQEASTTGARPAPASASACRRPVDAGDAAAAEDGEGDRRALVAGVGACEEVVLPRERTRLTAGSSWGAIARTDTHVPVYELFLPWMCGSDIPPSNWQSGYSERRYRSLTT
jgi:hypothetical protein